MHRWDRCSGGNKVREGEREYQNRGIGIYKVIGDALTLEVIFKHRSEGSEGGVFQVKGAASMKALGEEFACHLYRRVSSSV